MPKPDGVARECKSWPFNFTGESNILKQLKQTEALHTKYIAETLKELGGYFLVYVLRIYIFRRP